MGGYICCTMNYSPVIANPLLECVYLKVVAATSVASWDYNGTGSFFLQLQLSTTDNKYVQLIQYVSVSTKYWQQN